MEVTSWMRALREGGALSKFEISLMIVDTRKALSMTLARISFWEENEATRHLFNNEARADKAISGICGGIIFRSQGTLQYAYLCLSDLSRQLSIRLTLLWNWKYCRPGRITASLGGRLPCITTVPCATISHYSVRPWHQSRGIPDSTSYRCGASWSIRIDNHNRLLRERHTPMSWSCDVNSYDIRLQCRASVPASFTLKSIFPSILPDIFDPHTRTNRKNSFPRLRTV
jgi:hypothetical protein